MRQSLYVALAAVSVLAVAGRACAAEPDLARAVELRDKGGACYRAGDLAGAAACWEQSLAIFGRLAPAGSDVPLLLNSLGVVRKTQGDLDGALRYFDRARAALERGDRRSTALTTVYANIASVYMSRRDYSRAVALLRKAMVIAESVSPVSLDFAALCDDLAGAYGDQGDLDSALTYAQKGLRVRERVGPGSADCAIAYNNLGALRARRGDTAIAAELYRKALAIWQVVDPDSLHPAVARSNLAAVLRGRGDLSAALALTREALAAYEKLAPGTLECAGVYNNLAILHRDRGELERARDYYARALAIYERLGPGSLDHAMTLSNLGVLARASGDGDTAVAFYERALAVVERVAPASADLAGILNNLGVALSDRGDSARAQDSYRRALAIRERLLPGSLECAESYNNLGHLMLHAGDPAGAAAVLGRAVGISRALAPLSAEHAMHCANAAMAAERRGSIQAALVLSGEAVAVLDRARTRVAGAGDERQSGPGGADVVRAGFAAPYQWIYRNHVRLELKLGNTDGALEASERMRARGLREALLDRLTRAAGPEADAVLGERAALLDRVDSLVDRLSDATARGDKVARARLRVERAACGRALESLADRARDRVPALAGMLFPTVSPIGALRSQLGPDSVAVSYVWADDGAFVLVMRDSGPVVARHLPVRPEEVRDALFDRDGSAYPRDLAPALRSLWSSLVGPIADLVASARRLLICPDGLLYYVPWAALMAPDGRALADRCAVTVLPSLDTLVLLRAEAGERAAKRTSARAALVALGDPAYPEAAGAGVASGGERRPVRQPLGESLAEGPLAPLRIPFTGEEVARIAESIPGADGALTGGDASEEEFRARAPHARYVHVACHGYYNDRDPLESGVVLSLVGARPGDPAEDGVITARELLSMRLDADLVVLSACRTGAGREIGGEGLVGLTRAAMLAGTPSVVSTLWTVDDASTKELMVRFYAHLARGLDKAEALRSAQVSVRDDLAHPEWRDPRVWAGFQLWGAW